MRNVLISTITFSFLLLGGCQSCDTAKLDTSAVATPVAEAAKPTLSEEARQALAKAEANVKEAKAQKALWTTAADALQKAQEAAAKEDSSATLKFSIIASEHARLGLTQKTYLPTK